MKHYGGIQVINTSSGMHSSSFKAGMFLLETLTAGMYNNPLSIYREYIQNAADSIDLHKNIQDPETLKIEIHLDPHGQSVTIRDNGAGIPGNIAENILSSIGSSSKTGTDARGFRGIGRLGGIAFSDKAIFRTKASCDNFESIQEWDCKKLRLQLTNPQKTSLSLNEVFQEVTKFERINSKKTSDSYFEVKLEGVYSFRNSILDIAKVREYLSQVAPVPFNPQAFSYHKEIDSYLENNLRRYGRYNIILNGDPVFKPYQDRVRLTKKAYDQIDGVDCFDLKICDTTIANCWIGKRRELSGGIAKGDHSSGIRVRIGNILLGDAHFLDRCFREARFNSYCIGEIHVECPDLIPNSRRDDYVDNEMKTLFFNAVEKRIGFPLSKEIRYRSRLASNAHKERESKCIENKCADSNFNTSPEVSKNSFEQSVPYDSTIREIKNAFNTMCLDCPNKNELLRLLNLGSSTS